ncbi:MAG: hypothetical protein JWO67_1702 [Streptosporangiaceae bacterium]|nr:hypothetical protein [Streptosporangiaceae bacterium]
MPDTDDAPAFPWSPELLQAYADYFAAFGELEALKRPTFLDDYRPGVLEKEQELRTKAITASERIHADPVWNDHTGTDRLVAEMALKQAAKKQLGLTE